MKRTTLSITLLICLAFLLTACGVSPSPDSTAATVPDTASQPAPTEAEFNGTPAEPVTMEPIVYDKFDFEKRDVAIIYSDNCDYDLIPDVIESCSYTISIVSRSPLDVKSITVDVLGTDREEFNIVDCTEFFTYENSNGVMNGDYNAYLYQTQNGMDWKEAGRLYETYKTMELSRMNGTLSSEDIPSQQEVFEAGMVFQEYVEQHLNTYERDKKSIMNGSAYHLYHINIFLRAPAQSEEMETVEQIQLQIGQEQHLLDIGQIRLMPPERGLSVSSTGLKDASAYHEVTLNPWNRGVFRNVIILTAEDDITLKKLELLDEDRVKMLGNISVQCSTSNGQTLDMQWDGASDLYIDKGNSVQMYFNCYDPDMAGKLNYRNTIRFRLDYSCKSETYTFVNGLFIDEELNPFDMAAMYLEGIDLKSYFVDYYNVWESYQK